MRFLLSKRSDCGFTLIEMLIAIAVSGIVLSGLTWIFTTSNWAYKRQDETATLQQNIRIAKMNLERDIRMAGCGMGTIFNYLGNRVFPITNVNDDTSSGNSDQMTINYVNYSDPCSGTLPQLSQLPQTMTPVFVFDFAAATITVDISSCDLTSTANPPYPAYSSWNNMTFPFLAVFTRSAAENSINLRSDVFTVTGIAGPIISFTDLINTDRNNQPISNSGLDRDSVTSCAINIFCNTQLVSITYRYNSTNRTIEQNGTTLAEDIEDFQLAFGLDSNGDGVVDTGEWVNNQTLDNVQRADVRIVRVSILGRSSNPINGLSLNARPAIEDHSVGTVQDRHLRQLIQFDVALRNVR